MTYWDTSALLKLYVIESGSHELLQIAAESGAPIASSAIAVVEMLCALYRKEADGDLKKGSAEVVYRRFLSDLAVTRIVPLPLDANVTTAAEGVALLAYQHKPKLLVRSLDAIHLATALAARTQLMVSADSRLRDLARRAGMAIAP